MNMETLKAGKNVALNTGIKYIEIIKNNTSALVLGIILAVSPINEAYAKNSPELINDGGNTTLENYGINVCTNFPSLKECEQIMDLIRKKEELENNTIQKIEDMNAHSRIKLENEVADLQEQGIKCIRDDIRDDLLEELAIQEAGIKERYKEKRKVIDQELWHYLQIAEEKIVLGYRKMILQKEQNN